MGHCRTSLVRQLREADHGRCRRRASSGRILARADCLEQLLEAFRDILDRDDIHQAAYRLGLVLEWIREQAEAAEDDPIFVELETG